MQPQELPSLIYFRLDSYESKETIIKVSVNLFKGDWLMTSSYFYADGNDLGEAEFEVNEPVVTNLEHITHVIKTICENNPEGRSHFFHGFKEIPQVFLDLAKDHNIAFQGGTIVL